MGDSLFGWLFLDTLLKCIYILVKMIDYCILARLGLFLLGGELLDMVPL